MSKLLRVRDRILLGLALVHDLFDEVRLVGGIVPSAYKEMYGFTPRNYKRSNLYTTVHRMLKADFVERVVENGEPKFRITSSGTKKLVRDFPLFKLQSKSWDKMWRVVIFDIPESIRWERDKLRKKLKELSFGLVQKSVWISPHPFENDIREFLKASRLNDFTYLFVAKGEFGGNVSELVESVWKVSRLNSDFEELVTNIEDGQLSGKQVVEQYFDLVREDPFLPKELLPQPWWGEKAREMVKVSLRK